MIHLFIPTCNIIFGDLGELRANILVYLLLSHDFAQIHKFSHVADVIDRQSQQNRALCRWIGGERHGKTAQMGYRGIPGATDR